MLADIPGPACITHIWMTQPGHYRECLLRITWDDAPQPSIIAPLGDFFGLGNGIVNSYQSLLFSASAEGSLHNLFEKGCALNCYLPMPFRRRALVELANESREDHVQYFYVDYETLEDFDESLGYAHAEFRRYNPLALGRDITSRREDYDVVNRERDAWEHNYVILDARGRGHYVGCFLSVANFGSRLTQPFDVRGGWWGEGDDMIWVDGYKWPPDLHGTGSEDYFNQAWGMQRNAFLRNGSSIYEYDTGGYQTSYVFHVENPVRFQREIRVTIERGHANQLENDVSSVAYWYADRPSPAVQPPGVEERRPVRRDNLGSWIW